MCFLFCIPKAASTETTEERQPQPRLSPLRGLSGTIRSTTPSPRAIRAFFSFSHTRADFYEDAQEQSVFQEDLISPGSKHHVTISQLQLRHEKQL